MMRVRKIMIGSLFALAAFCLPPSSARLWVLRLHPGDDLVDSVTAFARQNSIDAGAIVTCVGSLNRASLRFAGKDEYREYPANEGTFEIVSLVGTVSTTGHHLHLAIADKVGTVYGGHAGPGNKVFTTAEIVIAEASDWIFRLERDPVTTYQELVPLPAAK
jgi:predicted DNA-binding protein with PD1-like motif